MANYYTKFSVIFSLETEAQVDFAIDLFEYLEFRDGASKDDKELPAITVESLKDIAQGEMLTMFHEAFMDSDFRRGFELDRSSPKMLWLFAEENGEPWDAAVFIRYLLKYFQIKQAVTFEFAYTCSSMRPDGFGGGAYFVTADELRWCNSGDWVVRQLEAFKVGPQKPKTQPEQQ